VPPQQAAHARFVVFPVEGAKTLAVVGDQEQNADGGWKAIEQERR
jgi:hypothetical protein